MKSNLHLQDHLVLSIVVSFFLFLIQVRFSPILYKFEERIFSVFALGDNDGNISVWRLSNDMKDNELKAMKLFKSHQNASQIIEDITWSKDVNYLI